MKTVSILIGNSDNRLSQMEWSLYVKSMHDIIDHYCHIIHFKGFTPSDHIWQSAAWVIEIEEGNRKDVLYADILDVRKSYHQESVAIVEGVTNFI